MNSLFINLTDQQIGLLKNRNELIDQQGNLMVHNYRTDKTVLTADDKKFDCLQKQINVINAKLQSV